MVAAARNAVVVAEALCGADGIPQVGWNSHRGEGVEVDRVASVGGAHGGRGSQSHRGWAL